MKKIVLSLMIGFLLFFIVGVALAEEKQFDKYGGWIGLCGDKTGVFHTQYINNRWWIITPEGNVFWSTGMYCVRIGGIPETDTGKRVYKDACLEKYGNEIKWSEITRAQLKKWGFNTIGDWSSESIYRKTGVAYVAGIDLPRKAENVIPEGSYGYFPDVFSQEFKDSVRENMENKFKNQPYLIDDPSLLGYFLADEPSWYGSKGRRGSLTDDFMALDNSKAGKKAWVEYMRTKHIKDSQVTEEDKLEFLKVIAEQFSKVLHDALREYDKYHMILGTRPTRLYPEVIEGMSKYVDVFSASAYELNRGYSISPELEQVISDIYVYSQKPIMLGVLISGQDTGLPYGTVKTQRDRGVSYWRYLAKVASNPNIVGMLWYQYFDPPKKCFDNTATNWGMVNEKDEPYEEAVSSIAQANKMVYAYALGLTDFAPEFDGFLRLNKKESPGNIKGPVKLIPLQVNDPGFEPGGKSWAMQTWKGKSKASIDFFTKHSGMASLKIAGGTDKAWGSVGVGIQGKPGFVLKPGYQYKLSAWIKTKAVENSAFVRIKATYKSGEAAYFETEGAYGTKDWQLTSAEFSPREENVVDYLGCQLVGKGTTWFDDIKLEMIE